MMMAMQVRGSANSFSPTLGRIIIGFLLLYGAFVRCIICLVYSVPGMIGVFWGRIVRRSLAFRR
jgi:hypothetical protein